TLSEVTGEEQCVPTIAAQRRKQAELGHADILRLVHDGEIKWSMPAAGPGRLPRLWNTAACVMSPRSLNPARRRSKIGQSVACCRSGRRVLRPTLGTSRYSSQLGGNDDEGNSNQAHAPRRSHELNMQPSHAFSLSSARE